MIEIKNLVKRFDTTIASNNLTLNLDEGIIGLVGENGAGKSTLLRLIANVIYEDEGKILIDGYKNNLKEAKEKVFFLPDEPYVKNHFKIKDVFNFYSSFYSIDKDKFNRLIDIFSLPLNRKVSSFSKGMKRRLFIAISLSIKTKYLLLDEAFDGLDPLVLNTIKDEILKLKEENKVVIIASHNINTLNLLADRIIILYKGKLEKDGSCEDFANELIKYQLVIKDKVINEENLKSLNVDVISFKKIGSIYNIVIKNDDLDFVSLINKNYNPLILEEVPLDSEEIIMLNMMSSRKGDTINE